jgi:hypothetical protein|tara:strand:- start:5 stop:430 length:426 start_codon:yes stop_codon:yes gene_type:complete
MELWIKLILSVTIINVFGFFIMKKLTNNNNCFVIVSYLFLFTGIIAFLSLLYLHFFTNISITSLNNINYIILLAIMNFISYTLLLNSVNYTANPGYVRAFVALEISILTIAFSYFYKKSLTIYKLFGLFSIIVGIIAISFP